jgi:hypothetical protein
MRRPTAKSLQDLLPSVLGPVLAEHGVATSQLVTHWQDIVGQEFGALTRPLRLNWLRQADGGKPDQKTGATLILLVESAFALDVQHAIPLILERINAFYGFQAVVKIKLRQGQVKINKAIKNQILNNKEAPEISGINEAPLRNALQKLGKAIACTQEGED